MNAPPPPPHTPVEVWKDFLEENPAYVGLQDAPTFNREAAYLRWLEQSGTFERLGECMVMAMTPIGLPDFLATQGRLEHPHYAWREAIGFGNFNGASESPLDNPELYAELCGLFGVPAVFVEVEWSPPSPQLAAAVLRHCMEHRVRDDASLVAEMERIGPQGMCDCLTCCMRQHMKLEDHVTGATTARLRFGAAGEWHIETGV